VGYLKKSHEYYLSIKIPRIAALLRELSQHAEDQSMESLQLINRFFSEYQKELSDHILHEEDRVYPYVYSVEEAYTSGKPTAELVRQIREYSITDYESDHDNVEDKLFDLQNIIIKYLPPPLDMNLCHNILMELFRLESDLNDHARIEDKVLVPKVRFMEKWIEDHFTQPN
jgi:regulator of cell morphogenesis and NO signaling